MPRTGWRIRLSEAAEHDFEAIIRWSIERFGLRQTQAYRNTLITALTALGEGPDVVGSRRRDEVLPGLRTLHIARRGRRGSHVILYRATGSETIEVIRILHEAMDLPRHVPEQRADREP